jgi:DNA polymerase-3 subunit delta'
MALVVAKALNCQNKHEDSCDICSSCQAIDNRNFPDVMELVPEKDKLKIEQMRILKSTAYLKPMVGKKRVFLIGQADKMTEEAANSLLKILEEPPPLSHILLLTDNPYLIIPTIKSRCQILAFSPIFQEDIEKILLDKGYERGKARVISLIVHGNLKQALSLDWEDVQKKREMAWQIFLTVFKRKNVSKQLKELASIRKTDKLELEQIFEILASFCRDVILLKEGGDLGQMMNPDFEQEIQIEAGSLSLQQSLDFLKKIDYSLYALKKNLNVNLLISSMFSNSMDLGHD